MTQQLDIARTDYLFAQLKPALSSTLLGMSVATLVFWQQTGAMFFFVWFGLMAGVGIARYLLYERYKLTSDKNYHRWLVLYRGFACAQGLLWAVLALAGLHYGGTPTLSVGLIFLAGVTATASVTAAVDLKTFYAYGLVALLPVSTTLLFQGDPTLLWLGAMMKLFLFIMAQVGRTYNRTFCEALTVRCENEALVRTLEQEKGELAHEKERAEQLAEQLYELSSRDGLTGLFNRRAFDSALEKELTQGGAVSLILCDIDAFKAYNDFYGHLQGDVCLKNVANTLLGVVTRPGDTVARYGGEEFGIILAETDAAGAQAVASKLRTAIRRLELVHETSPVAPIITVSFGVASVEPGQSLSAERLIDRADKALYRAKTQGRDRIVSAERPVELAA